MKKSDKIIQVGDIDIGRNIKKLREERNLTQTEVLIRLQLMGIEISVYSFSKIENNRQNPTVSLLSALTQILKCDYNAFFQTK